MLRPSKRTLLDRVGQRQAPRKLSDLALRQAASDAHVTLPQLLAVLAVESRGPGNGFVRHRGFWVPVILFEAHHFYRHSGAYPVSRDFPHLSSKRWNRRLYNRTGHGVPAGGNLAWTRLEEAVALDKHYATNDLRMERAALLSCSWGLGQVLGSHAESLGHAGVHEFVDANRTERGQLNQMLGFLRRNRLLSKLTTAGRTAASWRGFARGYNGASYAVHNYHGKLARAFRRFS